MNALSARLRDARTARALTMTAVADHLGVSQPTISRIESGLRDPSLAQLIELASLYETAVGQLLGETPAPRTLIVDSATAIERVRNELRLRVLDRADAASTLSALEVVVPAGRTTTTTYRHPGEEWIYVLDGALELSVDGDVHHLRAGMAAHFDATLPHRLGAPGADVRLLLITARPSAAGFADAVSERP